MAPSLWTPIFFLVSVAVLSVVTVLYFCSLKAPSMQVKGGPSNLLNSWPW